MLGPFPFSGTHASRNKPSVGSATRARGYARHYLWNTSVFWSVISLACISSLGYLFAQRPLKGEMLFYAAASLLGVLLAYSFWRASRALRDLMSEPVDFEGRVASKASYIFWNKLAFLEEKYHIRIVRGLGMRPLTLRSGKFIKEGWFLAAQGYHDLLAPGDQVRGTLYPRTRVIDSLVKV
ncbi:MAG: hypothetical protein OXL41_07850 [Nitrospinae bacterium]|nr:hypothetical protein [Nitrospinota bacterium]